ncbi:adenylate/guanylate cyclase domain-containing protein [Bradyrhizobium commune]|uniref:Adenylate/guanylate cyclase domain-containing protein n=1 Tax=Bradyrhizobium commune TaxID=83627 RepID=A0A7S9CZS9_9BRAD|nr:adenylate/guanylate cyclase domain-containing protein [Bradyrhizobium commune]QPF88562.1 adenylate/guanylate cyclase domain-containing protein [Bradyrhizobium commune]
MNVRVDRRLAAILAADVAGYSRLMGEDEEGTLARLKSCRKTLVDPKIAEHRGRIVKTTGDGMLVEFGSAVDAVRCAVEVQRAMAGGFVDMPVEKRIQFRIGIHVGDIIIDSDDIFGDGVNIAARLEGIAEPGGICVSDDAYRQIRGKTEIAYDDMGHQSLKNISEPMRAWRARPVAGSMASMISADRPATALALPDKPSIAVLPFTNMSGDPEQEYFADGMVEDIITALSRMTWLFVIARNSSFTYKGKAVDIKQVGRELGVRYVLEGSVRKAGSKVRITGQLIDTSNGAHLWADRFDGALEDVFELQDEVTTSVIGAIAPKLEQAEIERARHKPTDKLAAYDYYLHGMANIYQGTRDANVQALQNFQRATQIDPNFATAHGMSAYCYVWRKANGWIADPGQETAAAESAARKAAKLGFDDAIALAQAGFALAFVAANLDDGAALIDRALNLNPNLAAAWRFSGYVRAFLGDPELAIEHLQRAIRLSPLDPLIFIVQNGIVLAHFFAGRYDEALDWAQRALRQNPNYAAALIMAAVSAALTGRNEDRDKAVDRLRALDPQVRVANFANVWPLRRAADLAAFEQGLRLTGLPS